MILQTISSIIPDKMACCVIWHLIYRTTENRFSLRCDWTDADFYILGTFLSANTARTILLFKQKRYWRI